ncbi:MAG: BadF/BadG/BcrA/BcrD ATPase family protein [Pseudomonadota bacterium]
MQLYLGIDGGGTGCRAAVADASGRVLGVGAAGPANVTTDLGVARGNILSAAQAALRQAGAGDLSGLRAGLGLAGANALGPQALGQLDLPFARVRLESDAIAAVKGALGPGDGIVAAIGTGSVFARQTAGAIRQIGGWGAVLGDEGSGAVLGRALLARALRAVDGLDPMTPLLGRVLAEQGGAAGVVQFARTAQAVDFAAFAPRIVGSDDPAAQAVLAQGVADVARAVDHLQGSAPLPVVFIGGLGPAFAQALAGRWQVASALGTALDGALLLAREGP